MQLEARSRSILFVMMAMKPDIELFLMVFNQLCQKNFSQCIHSIITLASPINITEDMNGELQHLCPQCIEECFLQEGCSFSSLQIGKLQDVQVTSQVLLISNTHDQLINNCQFCTFKQHRIDCNVIPDTLNVDMSPSRAWSTCWSHNKAKHDFFLSYRVACEGEKSPHSHTV